MSSVNDRAAQVMEHLCSHSAHGYSQPNRAGVGTGGSVSERITLTDGTVVGIAFGDRDCSSAAIECYAALGVDCGGATYTGNMRRCMTGTGMFSWITDLSQRQRGDQTGYESNIKGYYNYPWNGLLRYVGPDSDPHDVVQPPMQDSGGKIVVDGYWGSATTLLAQIVTGAPFRDGIVSRQEPYWRSRVPGCTIGWEWGVGDGSGSPVIKLLQKAWGVTPDGILGPATINAMIRYYARHGSGATIEDGRLDAPSLSIKCMQRRFNEGVI